LVVTYPPSSSCSLTLLLLLLTHPPPPPTTHHPPPPSSLLLLPVIAGGYLDIRYVTTYRAEGRLLNDGRTSIGVGSTAMVDAGASFIGTG